MNDQQKAQATFNLHITGRGFLSRAREVTPRKGPTYLALDVKMREGQVKDGDFSTLNRVKFDVIVTGAACKEIVRKYLPQMSDRNCRVEAGMKLAGLDQSLYTYKDNGNDKTGISNRSRLIRFFWLRINNEKIDLSPFYGDEKAETTAGESLPKAA